MAQKTILGWAGWAAVVALSSCNGPSEAEPSLSKTTEEQGVPDVPTPPENGPKLGAIAEVVPELDPVVSRRIVALGDDASG